MRELERDLPAPSHATLEAPAAPAYLAIVGSGRAGRSIAAAARRASIEAPLLGKGETPVIPGSGSAAVLLCVPDAAITDACERIAGGIPAGTSVGHVSGATRLDALTAAAARGCPTFSLHPLQTIPAPDTELAGASCAVAGADAGALALAQDLARVLGMRPFDVPDEGRAAYHAAAAMASNFLVALEESAAELLAAAGVAEPREALAPLVLRSAANWADAGAAALTGPIARGDESTVARHLEALAAHSPELVPLYEALAERTREVVARDEEPR